MIVVDASAAVAALMTAGRAREILATASLHAPHLADSEVLNTLRRLLRDRRVGVTEAERAVEVWSRLGVRRHPVTPLTTRIWQLRDNVTCYDAAYVALAESLDCPLMTADARLSRSPGLRCTVTVVPN